MKDTLLLWQLKHGRKDILRRMYEKYCNDMLTLAAALVRDKAVPKTLCMMYLWLLHGPRPKWGISGISKRIS